MHSQYISTLVLLTSIWFQSGSCFWVVRLVIMEMIHYTIGSFSRRDYSWDRSEKSMGQIKKKFGKTIVEISRGCSLGNKCRGSIVRLLLLSSIPTAWSDLHERVSVTMIWMPGLWTSLSWLGKTAKSLFIFLFLFFSFLIGLTTTRWSTGKYHVTLSQCHNGVTDGHSLSVSHDWSNMRTMGE